MRLGYTSGARAVEGQGLGAALTMRRCLEHLAIAHGDHQPDEEEATEHLDELPPEEVRLGADGAYQNLS